MSKQKFYVVWKGNKPGVFTSWEECKKSIQGFTGALYKSFKTIELAEKAFMGNPQKYLSKNFVDSGLSKDNLRKIGKPNLYSISVDAACSGNPGVLEYQGVDTRTKKLLFHMGPFPEGTVNLGEFLAIVHGLAFLQKQNSPLPIYTDSKTAMKWVRDKKTNTKLERTPKNEELFQLVDRGIKWLKENTWSNPIVKWETAAWGEIPADFDRK